MRGKKAPKRPKTKDKRYKSKPVQELIDKSMMHGKKTKARKSVYEAFEKIKEKTKKEPLDVFKKALDNVRPNVELRSRRVGGANYQVPVPVTEDRSITLAIRWIVNAARNKKGKPYHVKLMEEILDASQNTGEAIQKKETTHKMAEANKAFAIFRW